MMSAGRILTEAAQLIEARQPFVLVTVTWRRGPTSGQAGAKAIILGDGSMRGWIGGACAQPSVLELAQKCLETATPALVRLGVAERVREAERPDVVSVSMACESDGAMEIYMEPVVPSARIVVVGRSPAVDALASMGLAIGWDATIVDDGGTALDHPEPHIVRTKLDLHDLHIDAATAVVVATQGHYDDLALAAALDTDAGYIGLVASRKRAAAVLEQLRADGLSDSAVDRVHAPAGLDLGPLDHVEIAAAILADLVQRKTRGELAHTSSVPRVEAATDPICGMTVHVEQAKYHSIHEGADYWFCASGCKRAFDADPVSALRPA